MNIFPLFTTIVAGAFTFSLFKQYQERKKFHQLLWSLAMLAYAIAALMEFLMNGDIFGPTVWAFKVYYVLSAPLVGLLGAGVMYLLVDKKKADIFTGIITLLSLVLLVKGFTQPIDQAVLVEAFNGPLGEAFHEAIHAYTMDVRKYAIVINIIGGMTLILGAVYSFIKDRRRTYNIYFVLGGLFPGLGGTLMGIFGDPNLFFEFELIGTIFLYAGFIYSDRFIKDRDEKIAEILSAES
ncbi:hypothetical protein HN807_10780 [Candidatus Bathyarchaeota archaeon]|nr:hypothetical protein [Candidatus Bathyarchaeota archaeon]MBT4319908.1 hypothetical protein [Candidatus Bathyarchaeota archaeon]MBT4422830.1 hypothetical protein [Candidatus Bathyarchaeota archaeon]MBT6605745.1 hypothetical protein [Candidatus Bathyarchaeota archaeon]MBT7186086.1 hypothetical protein [Candidatus Bathyarchaeota archaeon]